MTDAVLSELRLPSAGLSLSLTTPCADQLDSAVALTEDFVNSYGLKDECRSPAASTWRMACKNETVIIGAPDAPGKNDFEKAIQSITQL